MANFFLGICQLLVEEQYSMALQSWAAKSDLRKSRKHSSSVPELRWEQPMQQLPEYKNIRQRIQLFYKFLRTKIHFYVFGFSHNQNLEDQR